MDALTALHHRVSISKLAAPGPTIEQRENMLKAAFRAADHGNLRPWRFLCIEGEGLQRLGDVFVRAAKAINPAATTGELERLQAMPMRAPLIVVAIAACQVHPKVPLIEQVISAGAATQNFITAAYALGVGAIWRTGEMAYNSLVMTELGLGEQEKIIGFVYLGTPVIEPHTPKSLPLEEFFTLWPQ